MEGQAGPAHAPSKGELMYQFDVLVIEDQTEWRQAAEAAFARLGCRVATAASPREALKVLAGRRFNIVCLDPMAFETEQVLAQLTPDQYAVAWRSVRSDLSQRFDGVLVRPVTPIVAAVTLAMANMAAMMSPPASLGVAA
jgi:CheY-like chemotaxis protein